MENDIQNPVMDFENPKTAWSEFEFTYLPNQIPIPRQLSKEIKLLIEGAKTQTAKLLTIGETGCCIMLTKNNLYATKTCQVIIKIGKEKRVTLEGHIKTFRGNGKTFKFPISFTNVTQEQKNALLELIDELKNPLPRKTIADAIKYTKEKIRKLDKSDIIGTGKGIGIFAVTVVLGGTIGTYYDTYYKNRSSPEKQPPDSITSITDTCRIRFEDGYYFASCDTTREENLQPELKWLPKSDQPKDGAFKADIEFQKGKKLCRTVSPVTVNPEKTEEKPNVKFRCAESQPK